MAQVAFQFEQVPGPAAADMNGGESAEPQDPGFAIGWDHARHGELPPAQHLHPSHPVRQGWEAGRASFAGRTRKSGPAVRRWLALRLQAWLAGDSFESVQLTPNFLAQICPACCPVSGQPDSAESPLQITRLHPSVGFAAGNLAALSPQVVSVMRGLTWQQAHVRSQLAGSQSDGQIDGLSAAQWLRLACLMSFVTPLPHALAASLPLHALPTNRLRLLNPIQGLQALVTLQLGRPAWSVHILKLVAAIPGAQARREFQLFFHCLLARVFADGLEPDALRLRERMQAAWGQERVQRRWQRFAQCLSPEQTESLLQRATQMGLAARTLQWHAAAQATDGWGLDESAACTAASVAAAPHFPRPVLATLSGGSDPRRQFGRRQVRQAVEAHQAMPLA